ncbi:uncharacterized protein ACBR49_003109 [Aulostomus maculatus]
MKKKKMATVAVSGESCEPTAMERFGSGGMALLPWTKQLLTVLWEQLRLLVQVIYYTFVSAFQMLRFEVHFRITDETGQHIQHMTTATNPTESFLFSSLFDGDNGVMVGGSNPLSSFCADVGDPFNGKTPTEALLSSLVADDLCCERIRQKDDGIFLGPQSSWNMSFPRDWKIFMSSSDCSSSNDGCHKNDEVVFKERIKERVFKSDTSEEERSSHWSSEEDQNLVEFDSEESRKLWDSLSKSSDPYNPFFFSACMSTNGKMNNSKSEVRGSGDADLRSVSKAGEEMLGLHGLNFWVSRSDSESSWSSWASSDGSSPDIDKEESERLLEFFRCPEDPYNPMCFTACTDTSRSLRPAPSPATPSRSDTDTEEKESCSSSSSEDDEEEQLWISLCQTNDPYHPLNFQANLHSSPITTPQAREGPRAPSSPLDSPAKLKTGESAAPRKPTATRNTPAERRAKNHSDKILVPWKRPVQTSGSAPQEKKDIKGSDTRKKVRFSPLVQVHVMRTWPFARQACRKGPWEEMARDRDRFGRRIRETEQAVGYCFGHAHREKARAFLDGALK